jgi:hypothetical protein
LKSALLFDRYLIGHSVRIAGDRHGLRHYRFLFVIGFDGTLQCHSSGLADDLDIVRVDGERLIGYDRLPDLFGQIPVSRVRLLLVGCYFA